MKNSKSKLQLFEGLWAITPSSLLAYQTILNDILIRGEADHGDERPNASIRYVLDEHGEKVSSSEDIPQGSIGVVNLIGPMVKYGNWWFWGADELVAMLESYDADPNIIGTILMIDSGGGQVSAVAPYTDFMKRKQKPVVALGDTVGSAAMWVSASADYSIAGNDISAMYGSIGVMVNLFSLKGYWKQMGIEEHTIYSDHSEDKNKSFELALEGKYEEIKKEHLNPLALKFQDEIKAYRAPKLQPEEPGLLTGRMFYSERAAEIGLVDEVADMQRAIEKVKELSAVQSLISNF